MRLFLCVFGLCLAALQTTAYSADAPPPAEEAKAEKAVALPVPAIAPVGIADVDAAIEAYAQALQQDERLFPTPEYQQRVITQNLTAIFKSFGYYDATIASDIKDGTLHITPRAGEAFHYGNITHVIEGAGSPTLVDWDAASLISASVKKDAPARATDVIAAEQALRDALAEDFCFYQTDVAHKAFVNHDTHKVDVVITITTGTPATFGETLYEGLTTVSPDYVHKIATLEKGACFKRAKVNSVFLSLQRSGFFGSVSPRLPDTPNPDGSVDVTYVLTEKAHRTFKAGAEYSTDIGPGVKFGWEHRNFLNHGEKFNADLSIGTVERVLSGKLKKPFFLRDDQNLTLSTKLKQEDNDAYETRGLDLSANVERKLKSKWTASVGTAYSLEQIKDQKSTENFALLSLPSYLTRDNRDDPLNPQKGWTARIDATPFLNTIDTDVTFFKSRISGSYFKTPDWQRKPTFAFRGAAGSIIGISSAAVPATQRYFVGGGGSVRGYGYQLVGPLDAQNDPLGGRSFLESSAEIRFRLFSDYGMVLFVDAGNVFDATYPDFDDGLLVGAGVGFRYYSSFGPLRFDIGIPLDKRRNVDDAFQLYFSIGQAF